MATHRPIKNSPSISYQLSNRLQQYKVFAELFSKSDRIPFPDAPHLPHFTAKGHRQKAMTFDFFIAPDIPEDPI
jgi:hypothetical protein